MGKNKGAKPTLEQKKLISAAGLVVNNWLVMKETENGLLLVNRNSGRFRNIKKSPVPAGRKGSSKSII